MALLSPRSPLPLSPASRRAVTEASADLRAVLGFFALLVVTFVVVVVFGLAWIAPDLLA